MKKLSIMLFSFLLSLNAYSNTEWNNLKEKNCDFFYTYDFNLSTLEYIIKLSKIHLSSCSNEFHLKSISPLKIYIYTDIVKFMGEKNAAWWQTFVLEKDSIYIYNVQLMMQKNILNYILKYLIYNAELSIKYKNVLDEWFINGLALYFSKFPVSANSDISITSFTDFNNKLQSPETENDFKQANFLCYKAVAYLFENYDNETIINIINTAKTKDELHNSFFNRLGLTYSDFINTTMGFYAE